MALWPDLCPIPRSLTFQVTFLFTEAVTDPAKMVQLCTPAYIAQVSLSLKDLIDIFINVFELKTGQSLLWRMKSHRTGLTLWCGTSLWAG